MNKSLIGLIDYGAGNCASVKRFISKLGYRNHLIKSRYEFKQVEVLLVPGVGAFPSAMKTLTEMNLIKPILEFANTGKPVIGVCLGMQLLADYSEEYGFTKGLGLIPGKVKNLPRMEWHIGWNTLKSHGKCLATSKSNGDSFYYNHSFEFKTSKKYIVGVTKDKNSIVSVVKKKNIYGMQFHPEISQISGFKLMRRVLEEFMND